MKIRGLLDISLLYEESANERNRKRRGVVQRRRCRLAPTLEAESISILLSPFVPLSVGGGDAFVLTVKPRSGKR